MKKFIFSLCAIAALSFLTPNTEVQATTNQTTICENSNGTPVHCNTGEEMGKPKKKRKKR